jgi:hypothetical protein
MVTVNQYRTLSLCAATQNVLPDYFIHYRDRLVK